MNTILPYQKTRESIKGYTDSKIASGEKNDCVVRAIASSFDITYDESHKFCEKVFDRKNRQGVYLFTKTLENFLQKNEVLNDKKIELVGSYMDLYYDVKVKNQIVKRALTVGKFIKENRKGTFLVSVKGHAFTIKDGVVIGNISDAQKIKKVLHSVWKIV